MAELIYQEEIDGTFDMANMQKIIKKARKLQNMTQKELGEKVGVSAAQICKIEGSYKNITFSTLLNIFEALNIKATFKPILIKKENCT
jgi:HTH-type transcriptional regulator/antitoxin HipB